MESPFTQYRADMESYLDRALENDPRLITPSLIEVPDSSTQLVVCQAPDRKARPKLDVETPSCDCTLCNDALTVGRVAALSETWSATINRYPAMDELLIVRNEHANGVDHATLTDWTSIAEETGNSILYSSDVNSIPGHSHATLTDYELPILAAKTIRVQGDLHITHDYPAPSIVIAGNTTERSDATAASITKLRELGIPFNLVVAADRTYLHPIKNPFPLSKKRIGAREAAGVISTSDADLYRELTNKNYGLAEQLLDRASYSEAELKQFISTDTYSYNEFLAESIQLADQVAQWETQHGKKVSHIVGTTRGGVALAAVMLDRLGADDVSLAGCYLEKTGSGATITHWKTPVGQVSGDTVLLTTDLIRSGEILETIRDSIKLHNPEVDTVLLAGSHLFDGDQAVDPDFVTHVLPTVQFMSYPWETDSLAPQPGVVSDDEPAEYKTMDELDLRVRKLGQDIQAIAKADEQEVIGKIIGVGAGGIMATAILSQHIDVRSLHGTTEQSLANDATAIDMAKEIAATLGSQSQSIVLCLERMDPTLGAGVEAFVSYLQAYTANTIYTVSLDTAVGDDWQDVPMKKFPWAQKPTIADES